MSTRVPAHFHLPWPCSTQARDSDLPKKRVRKRRKKEAEGEEEERSSVAVEALTIRLLAEGMVVLGRVQQVQEFGLRVSLPGAITGRVPLTKVSHPYSLLLRHFAQGVQEDSTVSRPLLSPLLSTFTPYKGVAVNCEIFMRSAHQQDTQEGFWWCEHREGTVSVLIGLSGYRTLYRKHWNGGGGQ